MDRDQLTQDYCQGFGVRVDGYYGIEQWEYLLVTDQIPYPINFVGDEIHETDDWKKFTHVYVTNEEEYESAVAAWELLTLDNLTDYHVDTERANAILDSAGWVLNREGGTYDPETDDVRCKRVDGELVALDLSMLYPEGNHIIDTLQENFIDNLNACGIKLTLVSAPMEELLATYYRETERTTDMIYLATNFHVIVDPSITYSTDTSAGHLMWNNTYSDDEDLYWRAVNMRKTDPDNVFDYVSKWISFQERYNEVLPTIPIYSNIYFDFFTEQLQNYYITAHVTWTQAILEAFWGQEGDTPPGIIPLGETEPEEEHHALVDIN
jgi:ABC-type transport system substrate-binding protein